MGQAVKESGEAMAEKEVREQYAAGGSTVPWVGTWIVLLSVAAVVNGALVVAAGGGRGFFLMVLAGVVCVLAALFDGWTGRIPNALTYPAIVLGLVGNVLPLVLERLGFHAASVWLGAAGWQAGMMGFGVCAGLGLLGAVAAGVHGGDVKLLAAVGAMLGLTQTAGVLIVALAVALVYAAVNLVVFGGLNAVISRGAMRGLELIYLRRFETPLLEEGARRRSHIPMAVPLAIGLVVSEIWAIKAGGGGL